jgi:hypothetical protein
MNRWITAWPAAGSVLLVLSVLVGGCGGGAKSDGLAFEQPKQPTVEERRRMDEAMKTVPGVGMPEGQPAQGPR